jgi:hypothetical protein
VKVIAAVAAFAVITGGIWWFVYRAAPVPPSGTDEPQRSVTVSSFDEFNQDLARRVTHVLVPGGASDFQVVVTPATDPIGTLYRRGRSVPFDDSTCAPSTQPTPRSMPNVFPAYTLNAKVAAEAGLDEALFQGVASARSSLAAASSFSFSIIDAQMKVLTDRAIQQVLAGSGCAAAASGEMVIVRGYVIGKRRFSTASDRTGATNAAMAKVGKFDVEASNAGLLSITDEAPQEFLQILSEVVVPAQGGPGNVAAPPSAVTAPGPVGGEGKIYVQQAEADTPASGSQVVSLLQTGGFKVESRVERTADKVTPDRAQVRYFNEADKEHAMQVLETFKQKYPDAVLVPLKIRAPLGQLEVWLPRVKTSLPERATTPATPRATIPLSPRRGIPLPTRRGTPR